MTRLLSRLRRDHGGATIETTLWIPFIFALFGLAFDFTMVFNGQARVLRILQEGNRDMSVGIYNETTGRAQMLANLTAMGVKPSSFTVERVAGEFKTRATVPIVQFGSLGYFKAFRNTTIDVTAEQMVENWET